MSWNDVEYFRNRADAERALAAACSNPVVAEVHMEMAKRYDRMVSEGDRPALRIVRSAS